MKSNIVIILTLLFICLVWLLSSYIVLTNFTGEERSQVGDSFNAINALFSGLALFGIIYAVVLQKQELSLQREELKLTREEMKRTANAQEGTETSLKNQVELTYLSNLLASKSSLLAAYAQILDPENLLFLGSNEAMSEYRVKLITLVDDIERLSVRIKSKEIV